ncbi:MAG TPA: glutamate-cysteine ligase family protein, partial [Noviherbaspirillum sp.]|nr:glutamate-cysteine ligase family protein [Noviherbaspirillum sp.]
LPIADRLLRDAPGEHALLDWSNELVLHVIEIKNPRPVASLSLLPEAFHAEIMQINQLLETHNARLMPGAMHPWMNPKTETQLWPHDNHAIYRAYDRIFDSKSHGWANLQSMHINLPFAGDEEFARLHAAIRLILPILPALAASSPIADSMNTGYADYRMQVYCDNAQAIPSIAGMVIPETITSRTAYEQRILAPMYRDIAPHDPEKVLRQEWLNSRGAIARFDRNAIEIRVIDTQEYPHADLAIAAATTAAVEMLYSGQIASLVEQQEMTTKALAVILRDCLHNAELTVLDNATYLRLLGFPSSRCEARELWQYLVERMPKDDTQQWRAPLETILRQGTLARRILRALGDDYSHARLHAVYRKLCDCLHEGRMFEGAM